ncbi:MAG: Uma2 family endonuclease [Lachnospiraceae bacterium]|nr:Uma2 family endonuclease [Lachnospiraceae bacterium]
MELDDIRRRLGYTYKKISELSGVPLSTVQKVLSGNTENPRRTTLQTLRELLLSDIKKQNGPYATYYYPDYMMGKNINKDRELIGLVEETSSYITDGNAAHKLYTVSDYYDLPDESRCELIHGILYDMAAPTAEHQIISSEIWSAFRHFIESGKGDCIPLMSPIDVQILRDDYNMVEPDIIIICNKGKLSKKRIYGAPDLIVEIVSPSSGRYDRITKLSLYSEAGVREYWIVDPIRKEILVYRLSETYIPDVYGFDDTVPVSIYDGACKVDFKKISAYVISTHLPF